MVIPTVALTLGAQVSLAEHINEKRTCLLLDNPEQVIGCAPALADLLARCPNLRLVATSRAPLRVRGEYEYSLGGLPNEDDIEAVIREEDNTRAALEWPLSAGEIELGLRLAVALEHYWVVRNPNEGVRTLQRLLAADRGVPLVLRARALRVLAGTSFLSGDYFDQTDRIYEQSLALCREAVDELGAAVVGDRLGLSAVGRGDPAAARPLLEGSLEVFRRLGSHKGEMQALGHLAYVAQLEGDIDRAMALCERSMAMAAEVDFLWWEASMCATMAELTLDAGRPDEATRWALRSLTLARALGDRYMMVCALAPLSCTAAHQGDVRLAGPLLGSDRRGGLAERSGPLEDGKGSLSTLAKRVAGTGVRARGARREAADARRGN